MAAGAVASSGLPDIFCEQRRSSRKTTVFAVHIGAKGVVKWVDLEVRLALSRPTGAADYPRLRRDLANVEIARRDATCTSKVDNTA
jgi:hypothetical protein